MGVGLRGSRVYGFWGLGVWGFRDLGLLWIKLEALRALAIGFRRCRE